MTGEEFASWLPRFFSAAMTAVLLVAAAFPFALVLGGLAASAQLGKSRALRFLGRFYSSVLRGTPELLVIYLIFFGGNQAYAAINAALGNSANAQLSSFFSGLLAVSLIGGAYVAESLKGGFRAINPGEIEAAKAFGMSSGTRLIRVIIPLTLRFSLPNLGNNWILLLKQTSLISVTGLVEIMRQARIAAGATREPLLFYSLAACIYVALVFASMLAIYMIERRVRRGI